MNSTNTPKTRIKSVIIMSLLLIIGATIGAYWSRQVKKVDEGQILEAATAIPVQMTVDYSKKIANGSPLVFGGAHAPHLSHQDAWDKIEEAGVTFIRKDFDIDLEIPDNISLEDYKNNKNNIQDVSTWNTRFITQRNNIFSQAKQRGMKVMGIVSYAPKWLTYSGTRFGVPRDWEVYEDIVKKAYMIHRDNVDLLEIWNEPNYEVFLQTTGTSYSTEQAYALMYEHAAKAIRSVDREMNDGKNIQLGASVTSNPEDTYILDHLLSMSNLAEDINFVSYHNYGRPEPSDMKYRDVLAKNNRTDLPIYITEWNYDSRDNVKISYHLTDSAIPYTGGKLIDFLKMNIAGANYFMLEPVEYDSPNIGVKYMGFYRWKNERAELLPQSKTWKVLSRQLKLGRGQSTIVQTAHDAFINAVGFINTDGEAGFAVVNENITNRLVTVKLLNIGTGKHLKIMTFEASAKENGEEPTHEIELDLTDGSTKLNVLVPAESVVGVIAQPFKRWYEVL